MHHTELHVPADAAARDALLSRVRTLTALDHGRLVAVTGAEVRGDSTLVVRWRTGETTDLATVLAVRGGLSPAEAAGVLVGVAQALAAMHSAGLVHGPLSALDIVLDAGGEARLRPRLDGSLDGTPPDDVIAVARLVDGLLGPHPGDQPDDDETTALRAVLAPALAHDPLVRPEAGSLAAWAHDAVPPQPVRLPEPAALAVAALGGVRTPPRSGAEARLPAARHRRAYRGAPSTGGPDHRRPGRPQRRARRRSAPGGPAGRVVGLVAVVVAVGALAGIAVQSRAPGPAPLAGGPGAAVTAVAVQAAETSAAATPPEPVRDPVLDPDDPAGAAGMLTQRRVALLTGASGAPDVAALGTVDAAGSAVHDADRALVRRMADQGVSLTGGDVDVHDVTVVSSSSEHAEVRVEYELGPARQRTIGGATATVPASGVRTSTLSLVWTDAGWRVRGVR